VTRILGCCALVLAIGLHAVDAGAVASRRVATGFDHPVFVASPPDDTRLFIVEQTGRIKIVSNTATGTVLPTPFLDLSSRIQIFSFDDEERGLLGLAFAPDYATTGLFYVQYVETPAFPGSGDVIVARFQVSANPNEAAPATEKVIFRMAKPLAMPNTSEAYHNGGTIAFGPDGLLWMATGDGGGWFGNDPNNCAQNAGSPLGKILRIHPALVPAGGITVPGGAACPQLPATTAIEIWAKGLRNPYRFSFDPLTHDLYVGDVGEDTHEEVDVLAASAFAGAGPNFGWRAFEGNEQNTSTCPGDALCSQPASVKFPVHEYAHVGNGCGGAITGGAVYRGSDPTIQGHYFYSDYCQGFIRSFVWDGAGGITNHVDRSAELTPDVGSIDVVTGFGTRSSGELYLVDWLDGEVFEVPEPASSALGAAALVTMASLVRGDRRRRLRGRAGDTTAFDLRQRLRDIGRASGGGLVGCAGGRYTGVPGQEPGHSVAARRPSTPARSSRRQRAHRCEQNDHEHKCESRSSHRAAGSWHQMLLLAGRGPASRKRGLKISTSAGITVSVARQLVAIISAT